MAATLPHNIAVRCTNRHHFYWFTTSTIALLPPPHLILRLLPRARQFTQSRGTIAAASPLSSSRQVCSTQQDTMGTKSKPQRPAKPNQRSSKNKKPDLSANDESAIDVESINVTHLYFWKETHPNVGYLCQWFYLPFYDPKDVPMERDGKTIYKTYLTAEHYMMHHKALLFGDEAIAAKILRTAEPITVKALGRKVGNFDDKTWNEHRERIVERGNYCKFTWPLVGDKKAEYEEHGCLAKNGAKSPQEKEQQKWELGNVEDCGAHEAGSFREVLLATGDKELVEASPFDKIWGIGFNAENASKARRHWGWNLLGKCLMRVRDQFREEAAAVGDSKVEETTV